MNNKEYFEKVVTDKSYGLCAAPLNAQTAINILCDYLLGEDFYIAMSMNAEQCNTVIVDNILFKYNKEYRKKYKKRKAAQKMTDNEIIKALECCLKGCNAEGCDDCPLYEKVEDCEIEIPIIALDLINRQKAKIERLKRYDEERDIALHARLIANAKTEAVREFVLKLTSRIHKLEKYSCDIAYTVRKSSYIVDDVHDIIDNLAKEMTEGENG